MRLRAVQAHEHDEEAISRDTQDGAMREIGVRVMKLGAWVRAMRGVHDHAAVAVLVTNWYEWYICLNYRQKFLELNFTKQGATGNLFETRLYDKLQ